MVPALSCTHPQIASIFDVGRTCYKPMVRGKDAVEWMLLDDLIVLTVRMKYLFVMVSTAAMKQQDMQIMEAAVNRFKSNWKRMLH
ncbi:hypothetical protein CVS40_12155 [Lucilia cuprina]|nr:hypothetical protein CVS40_12155 [Lucilia cuprina]